MLSIAAFRPEKYLNLSFGWASVRSCSFLGFVDMYGSAYEDDLVATGFGTYLAIPILRKRWRPDLTHDEAKALLEESITVCYYRDTRAINRVRIAMPHHLQSVGPHALTVLSFADIQYTIATVTAQGNKISEPYALQTEWRYKLFVNPQGQTGHIATIAQ